MRLSELYAQANEQFQAADSTEQRGFTIVLGSAPAPAESGYRDTPLPFADSRYQPPQEAMPEKLRQMRRLFVYGRESTVYKAKHFCRQAKFMEDYEDDAPWPGDFVCYFPTYQDLNTRQLRGYFAWRSRVRRGEFTPIAASAAYLYVYELLNGIGASSPEDSLRKLKDFETGFLDSGIGDESMGQNLRRWMLELAVVRQLPPELARQYADPELLSRDRALHILRCPEEHSDAEVFDALCAFGGKRLRRSPVLTPDPQRGERLFAEAWRRAAGEYRYGGKDLFSLCFWQRVRQPWHPLFNAIFEWPERPKRVDYVLDESRSYHCDYGIWQLDTYEKPAFDKNRLQGFLHETDRRLRRYLKTGRNLKESADDAWAAPFIDAVIEADRQAAAEAARPKITLDLSGLDAIRADAVSTRDSLLTEEERREMEETAEAAAPKADPVLEETVSHIPLDAVLLQILRTLLQGGDPSALIREHRRMPDLAADAINEALMDELGDVAVFCEDGELTLAEDYREEIAQLLGGTA